MLAGRDRHHEHPQRRRRPRRDHRGRRRARTRMRDAIWALPVVGETYDGALNDINGFHVRPEHVHAALAAASDGPVAEGNVGGGTGMICHEFKGGIGTASRRAGDWTVGVLVQANYGDARAAAHRRRAGRRRDPARRGALAVGPGRGAHRPGRGRRAARSSASSRPMRRSSPTSARGSRSASGWAWRAWAATPRTAPATCSCAFATGNRDLWRNAGEDDPRADGRLRMVVDEHINPLLEAVAEATEEAIIERARSRPRR